MALMMMVEYDSFGRRLRRVGLISTPNAVVATVTDDVADPACPDRATDPPPPVVAAAEVCVNISDIDSESVADGADEDWDGSEDEPVLGTP